MSKRILLVGCGQLGSRHLQAVACLEDVGEIHVVDPSQDSLTLGQSRLSSVPERNDTIRFYWHKELSTVPAGGDLCILATQARGRPQLLRQIAQGAGYTKFLVEKIVAQSMEEYQRLLEYVTSQKLSVWVNCPMRAFSFHQQIKATLDPKEPIQFLDVGGNHGLACNGVHYADLFLYYDGSDAIIPGTAQIDDILHPSKRGKDVFDLSGTLLGKSAKGSQCMISFAAQHRSPDYTSIVSREHRYIIDFVSLQIWESHASSDWKWKETPISENLFTSHTTKKLARDIMAGGTCALPTLKDVEPSHRFILNTLQPHFSRLLGQPLDHCPAT